MRTLHSVSCKQWLIDVSVLVTGGDKTGIPRTVRSLTLEWIRNPPDGYRVKPVYTSVDIQGYRYAGNFLNVEDAASTDDQKDQMVEASHGDVFVGLDLHHYAVHAQKGVLDDWHGRGVQIWYVVYDLLPIQLPHCFAAQMSDVHSRWLAAVARYDGLMCISAASASAARDWLAQHGPERSKPLRFSIFPSGADVSGSLPSTGMPADAPQVLKQLSVRPTFLMVGTLEPRKGHAQVLDALELLWRAGRDVNLAIVGRIGWQVEGLVERLHQHPENGRRLFLLESVSDEYLEKIYGAATCLVFASLGEGLGLPLIEAAQHRLPILARDLPVFREVAEGHASFFSGDSGVNLADAINSWLNLYRLGKHPRSDHLPWTTWRESAHIFADSILRNHD